MLLLRVDRGLREAHASGVPPSTETRIDTFASIRAGNFGAKKNTHTFGLNHDIVTILKKVM